MLRRKIYDRLLEWKSRPGHKCLVVGGQRQVGKTFIISRFGEENYASMLYVDLSKDRSARRVFSTEQTVDGIVAGLGIVTGVQAEPGSTLIFLDEIQVSPLARGALKTFTMDGRYDVVASGSLLGVLNPGRRGRPVRKMHGEVTFEGFSEYADAEEDSAVLPAGYEESLTLLSMDFEEFLWATGVPQREIDAARSCIAGRAPMPDALLRKLERSFRDYMIVGGMPAAVGAFAASGDYAAAGRETADVLRTCLEDVSEYNLPVDAHKVEECFRSIPAQLSQTNKKFMFSRIPSGDSRGTREKYDGSIEWVHDAGYAVKCYCLTNLAHPISSYCDPRRYKVYMSDTGMLLSMMGVNAIRALYEGDTSYNMGAAVENAVAEGIRKCGLPVRYFERTDNDRVEVDFVLEFGSDLVAVEVKSGRDRRSPSLAKVRERYRQVNRRVKLERGNVFVDETGTEHYPLFAACFIDSIAPEGGGPEFVAYGG